MIGEAEVQKGRINASLLVKDDGCPRKWTGFALKTANFQAILLAQFLLIILYEAKVHEYWVRVICRTKHSWTVLFERLTDQQRLMEKSPRQPFIEVTGPRGGPS